MQPFEGRRKRYEKRTGCELKNTCNGKNKAEFTSNAITYWIAKSFYPQAVDGSVDHLFLCAGTTPRADISACWSCYRLRNDTLIKACDCLTFGLGKASRAGVRRIIGVEIIDDGVNHDSLLINCEGRVSRHRDPVVFTDVSTCGCGLV